MAMSVRGALSGTDAELGRILGGSIAADGRTLITGREIRAALTEELSLGHELVPLCSSSACPSFDHRTGCPGHPLPSEVC